MDNSGVGAIRSEAMTTASWIKRLGKLGQTVGVEGPAYGPAVRRVVRVSDQRSSDAAVAASTQQMVETLLIRDCQGR